MKKIIAIAVREYRAMVQTKAFLLSITIMPILMFGGIVAMNLLKNIGRAEERTIAVVDGTGKLFEPLSAAIKQRNKIMKSLAAADDDQSDSHDDAFNQSDINTYTLARAPQSTLTDEERWDYSNQVRDKKLFAFVEIPTNVLETPEIDPKKLERGEAPATAHVNFYSLDSGLSEARGTVSAIINNVVQSLRLLNAKIDPVQVKLASIPVEVDGLGLVEKTAGGEFKAGEKKNEFLAIILPLGAMMLMFLVIFLAAQPALESVLEEKSARIAEVLLGCASPTQLMAGKLDWNRRRLADRFRNLLGRWICLR